MDESARAGNVPLPEGIREHLAEVTEADLNKWAGEAIVAEAARRHLLSRHKAATLLGLEDYQTREAFFVWHGLTNKYTLAMLEEDLEGINTLKSMRIAQSIEAAPKDQLGWPVALWDEFAGSMPDLLDAEDRPPECNK
jgi:hypothetical protein